MTDEKCGIVPCAANSVLDMYASSPALHAWVHGHVGGRGRAGVWVRANVWLLVSN